MNTSSTSVTDVLIAGAGPSGLVLGLWLARLGVRTRIIDKSAGPVTTSRALAVQSRTLEFYRQLGIAEALVERGRPATAINLWVCGENVARAVFSDMGVGLSPFPYPLVVPQDEHERLLIERLAEAGVEIERNTELLDFEDRNDRILARVLRADGTLERCEAAYVAGCDGARSAVRKTLEIGFPGGDYTHLFYVADVEGSSEAMNGEVHVGLEKSDFLAVFPLKGEGRARLVGTVREGASSTQHPLSWEDVSKRVIDWMRIRVERVNWFSTYRVHHRVADHFCKGRAFLVGDAAHIHSPVGGQGMNTGIGDAVNLAWKLAAVLQGRAAASILDTYEPERIAFARRLVATTDQAFTAVTSSGPIARFLRLDVAPRLVPRLFESRTVRRYLYRTVSQTGVNYRGSGLSEGRARGVHGGDRLPWAKTEPNGSSADNFAPLASLGWQVHVYGEAKRELRAACDERHLAMHAFAWNADMDQAGLRRDAVYLVRPDGYVGLADAGGDAATLASYLGGRGLTSAQ